MNARIRVLIKVGVHPQSLLSWLVHSVSDSLQSEDVGAIAFPCLMEEGDHLLHFSRPLLFCSEFPPSIINHTEVHCPDSSEKLPPAQRPCSHRACAC